MNPRGTAAHFTSCILAGLAMIPACLFAMALVLSTPLADAMTVKSWIRFLLGGALPLLIATTHVHYLRDLTPKSLVLSLLLPHHARQRHGLEVDRPASELTNEHLPHSSHGLHRNHAG